MPHAEERNHSSRLPAYLWEHVLACAVQPSNQCCARTLSQASLAWRAAVFSGLEKLTCSSQQLEQWARWSAQQESFRLQDSIKLFRLMHLRIDDGNATTSITCDALRAFLQGYAKHMCCLTSIELCAMRRASSWLHDINSQLSTHLPHLQQLTIPLPSTHEPHRLRPLAQLQRLSSLMLGTMPAPQHHRHLDTWAMHANTPNARCEGCVTTEDLESLQPLASTLRHLRTSYVQLTLCSDTVQALGQFTALEELSIGQRCNLPQDQPTDFSPLSQLSRLQTLALAVYHGASNSSQHDTAHSLMSLLTSVSQSASLTQLSLAVFTVEQTGQTEQLVPQQIGAPHILIQHVNHMPIAPRSLPSAKASLQTEQLVSQLAASDLSFPALTKLRLPTSQVHATDMLALSRIFPALQTLLLSSMGPLQSTSGLQRALRLAADLGEPAGFQQLTRLQLLHSAPGLCLEDLALLMPALSLLLLPSGTVQL